MPYFKWKGKSIDNKIKKGEIIAIDKNEAIAKLKAKKISVITVMPSPKEIRLPFLKKVKDSQLALVTRQIGEMLKSGLAIDDALRISAEQTTNKFLGETLYDIRSKVREGSAVSQALWNHKDVFSKTYVGMVRAGEQTGDLDGTFLRLAEMLEKTVELKRKAKGALIYPAVITVVAIIVIVIILTVAIPMFAKMYSASGLKLPYLTVIVINLSHMAKKMILPFFVILFTASIIAKVAYKKIPKFEYAVDYFLLKIPIIGKILKKISLSNFSTVFALLHNSGVGVLDALEISSESMNNTYIKEKINRVKELVKEGEMLSTSMSIVGEFTDMTVQMMYIGEESGKISDMLIKVADYYQKDVDNTLKNLTNMIEPIIILFMGTTVGFLVISMYLPIFHIGEAIK